MVSDEICFCFFVFIYNSVILISKIEIWEYQGLDERIRYKVKAWQKE